MHSFVYLAQRRSQEFVCEPNFWGGGVPPGLPGCVTLLYCVLVKWPLMHN